MIMAVQTVIHEDKPSQASYFLYYQWGKSSTHIQHIMAVILQRWCAFSITGHTR